MSEAVLTIGRMGERNLLRHLRQRIPQGPGVVLGVGDDAAAVETGAAHARHHRRHGRGRALPARMGAAAPPRPQGALRQPLRHRRHGRRRPATRRSASACPATSRSRSWTGCTTACSSARPRPASRSSAATSAAAAVLVIDVTLLGSGRAHPAPARSGAGRPRGGHGHAGRRRGGPALPGAGCAPRRRRGPRGGRRRVALRGARAAPLPARAARPGAAAVARPRARPSRTWCTRPWTSRTACRATSPGCARRARSRPGSTPRPCPSTRAAARLEKEGGDNGFSLALHGGEDYQLLLAVPPSSARRAQGRRGRVGRADHGGG